MITSLLRSTATCDIEFHSVSPDRVTGKGDEKKSKFPGTFGGDQGKEGVQQREALSILQKCIRRREKEVLLVNARVYRMSHAVFYGVRLPLACFMVN